MAGLRLNLDPSGIVSGGQQAENALEKVAIEAKRAEVATDRLSGSNTKLARTGGSTAYALRGVSQQLSQVGQQTMATGQFVQALAIQLPDIGLAFGTIGTAVGLLAGIALPMLINAFGGATEKAVTLKDTLSGLNDVQSGLVDTTDILGMNIVELYGNYGKYALSVRQATVALAELQVAEARASLSKTVLDSVDALDRYTQSAATAFSSGQSLHQAFVNIKNDLGVSGENAARLQTAFVDLKDAMSFEDRVAALHSVNAALSAAGVSAEVLPAELRRALIEASQAEIKMAELAKTSSDAAAAVSAISDNVPGAGWLNGAISGASKLAATLWNAAAAKAAATDTAVSAAVNDERGSQRGQVSSYGQFMGDQNRAAAMRRVSEINAKAIGKGGGKGGGKGESEQAASAFKSLMGTLDPLTAATNEYNSAQKTVNAALKSGAISTAEAEKAMALIEKRYKTASDAASNAGGVWRSFQDAGATALDRLIAGTASLTDSLKDMIKELGIAILKKQLLGSVTGGTASMSVGGLLMQGLFGGFHDNGGTIGMGQTGIVGERGPEKVTATTGGAVVTSRINTARQMGSGGPVKVDVGVSVDDAGNLKAYVKSISMGAARQAAGAAISEVRRNLDGWSSQLSTDGAIV